MASLYEEIPLRTRNAIRLLELSPGTFADPTIHIKLRRSSLTVAENNFEAISYTWGTGVLCRTVYYGREHGQQLEVTKNCYTALRYLRDPHESRILWIDAICINQSDIPERNIQVRIMGDIFAAAHRVVVFLGESNPESRILFQHFARTDEWIYSGKDPDALPAPEKSIIQGLVNLFKRPWFSRVWVIQELTNASGILFKCGEDVTTHMALHHCLYGYSTSLRIIRLFPAPLEMIGYPYAELRRECSTVLQEMYIAVLFTGLCQASDPRDRILALTQLVHSKSPALENLVDYSMSVEDIFENFTLLLLADMGLIALGLMRQPHSRNMPSWVPDWSQHAIRNAKIYNAVARFPQTTRSNLHRDFAITITSDIGSWPHRLLTVEGIRHGRVDQLSPVIRLQDDELITRDMKVKDLFATLNSMRLGMVDPHWPDLIMQALQQVQEEDINTLLMRGGPLNIPGERYDDEEISNIIALCEDHTLMVTSDGQLGMAPGETQVGDIVCSIKGGLDPWILRKQDNGYWKMISGSCFLLDVFNRNMEEEEPHPTYNAYIQDDIFNQESLEEFCIC